MASGQRCLWAANARLPAGTLMPANGTKEDVRALNAYLDSVQSKLILHSTCFLKPAKKSQPKVYAICSPEKSQNQMLLDIFLEHNKNVETFLGNGFEPNTLKGYRTMVKHLTAFLGHANLKTTQHYAKILDIKVSDDMRQLKKNLSGEL